MPAITEPARRVPTYTFKKAMRRDDRVVFAAWLKDLTYLPPKEKDVAAYVASHVARLTTSLAGDAAQRLQVYASFLPPRLVSACRDAALIPFFGSGISIAAGIPSWAGLLEKLGLATDYLSDPHVEHDALTQAELIAHAIGTDALQQKVLELTADVTTPALAHHLLAELKLPVYMTTNYDALFELAWTKRWGSEPIIITNDADVSAYGLDGDFTFPVGSEAKGFRPVLIKLHGNAKAKIPHLILTRSDYRHHYRSNSKLFELVKDLMRSAAVMFLGFSHRDPEVSRLVEDMVYRFESRTYKSEPRPLFSIQFDMRQRTPEIFAARGIVALRPPTLLGSLAADMLRSASVSTELAELMIAQGESSHQTIDLEPNLRRAVKDIESDVASAMAILRAYKHRVLQSLSNPPALRRLLAQLVSKLGDRAGQGVYATFDNGDVAAFTLPAGLSVTARKVGSLAPRPYFRQAQMFRREFVSDVFESIYNDHATVFFCMPLGSDTNYAGLLFAAAQPGAWKTVLTKRDESAPNDFILVDSNGISVVPPVGELRPSDSVKRLQGESTKGNQGFIYRRLHELSRRDQHIAHIVQNIVPIGFDDDVHEVSPDLRLYSMVANVKGTRWKLALSKAVPAAIPRPNTAPKD
jgi:hypothetical protein